MNVERQQLTTGGRPVLRYTATNSPIVARSLIDVVREDRCKMEQKQPAQPEKVVHEIGGDKKVQPPPQANVNVDANANVDAPKLDTFRSRCYEFARETVEWQRPFAAAVYLLAMNSLFW
jgi:hypothetical protein